MIIYEHKSAKKVTEEEQKYLRKMCIRGIGIIWREFKQNINYKKIFVIIARDKGIPIAWGLVEHVRKKDWSFMVYVKRDYRRRGIGTIIYRMAKRKHRLKDNHIEVFRHDGTSTAFFDKLQS
jgi:hypothetical protein